MARINLRSWTIFLWAMVAVRLTHCKTPHVIFIVADDLGWNDVSWHNPTMKTPNLEKLARGGIILNHTYVQHWCSPSRSAFMTGYFPIHTGMQHTVIPNSAPYGLPLNLTILPQHLKKLGYATHIVGKWHQGYCNWAYTPTERGFDTFYGYYIARENHFNHSDTGDGTDFTGKDFRDNKSPVDNLNGVYGTYAFVKRAINIIKTHDTRKPLFLYLPYQNVHGPVQVPAYYENMYAHIVNEQRRKYCGMVTILDEAVGNVTQALKDKGIFDNSVIIFSTDNGGQPLQGGNNWPLRGAKTTLWEGGTRGVSFIHSNHLRKSGYTYDGITHAADWFPTILSIAGAETNTYSSKDGFDIWKILSNNETSPRDEFVYNIDEQYKNGAIRKGRYKLIVGWPGSLNKWYPEPKLDSNPQLPNDVFGQCRNSYLECAEVKKPEVWPFDKVKLFDLQNDPTEHFDIAQKNPQVVKDLTDRFKFYLQNLVPGHPNKLDPASDPKFHGGFWSPGWC